MASPRAEPPASAARRVRLALGSGRVAAPGREPAEERPAEERPAAGLLRSRAACNLRTRVVCELRADRALALQQAALAEKPPRAAAPPSPGPGWQTLRACLDACSSLLTLGELGASPSQAWEEAAGPPAPPPAAAPATLLTLCLSPQPLTRLERRAKARALLALQALAQRKGEARGKQGPLLQESRRLLEEKLHVYDESKFLADHLSRVKEQCTRKHQALWEEYLQQSAAIGRERQALAAQYRGRSAELRTQLMQGRKALSTLKRQLQAVIHNAKIKERQDMKLEALKQEQARVLTDTPLKDLPAHLEFLQRRESLEKKLEQLEQMDLKRCGGKQTRELAKKAKALESTARQVHLEFCSGISTAHRQIRKDLQELNQQCQKLNATKKQLEAQQQKLKEEQWYLEALRKGRRRLQAQRESEDVCPKARAAPQTPRRQFLGPQARINPKGFLQLAMK
ncbi:coiled-coil domain-containing protein 121-like [Perognathus longimembris pacificus]|uniref:coiled-coil domain-containing protein 121-like n=1 Tax=Perognathus longimembris pacificus TaxID=214514 RepID=UPI0020195E57|nr:coiled-coil domain-containing protein 121-like [Perognathus longimembris pacificus]